MNNINADEQYIATQLELKSKAGRPKKFNYPEDCLTISEQLAYRRLWLKCWALFNIDIENTQLTNEQKRKVTQRRTKNRLKFNAVSYPPHDISRGGGTFTISQAKYDNKIKKKPTCYAEYLKHDGIELDETGSWLKHQMIDCLREYGQDRKSYQFANYSAACELFQQYLEENREELISSSKERRKIRREQKKIDKKNSATIVPVLD